MPPQKPDLPQDTPDKHRSILNANMEWHLDSRGRYPDKQMIEQWTTLARDAENHGITSHEFEKNILKTMGYTGAQIYGLLGGKNHPNRTDDRHHRKSTKSHG